MTKIVFATLLLVMTACATDGPRDDSDDSEESTSSSTSSATVYGQIAVSGDYISTD